MLDSGVTERTSLRRLDSKTPSAAERAGAAGRARRRRRPPSGPCASPPACRRWPGRAPPRRRLRARPAGVRGHRRRCSPSPPPRSTPTSSRTGRLATVDAAYAATVAATLACAARLGPRAVAPARAAALGLASGWRWWRSSPRSSCSRAWPWSRSCSSDRAAAAAAPLAAHAADRRRRRLARRRGVVPVPRDRAGRWAASMALRALSARWPRPSPACRRPCPPPSSPASTHSLADERGEWDTVLLGRRHPQGVWFYFRRCGC